MSLSIKLPSLAILYFGTNSKEAENRVVEDFSYIPLFFRKDAGEIDVSALEISLEGDTLVFSDVNLLASAIVNISNAIGLFRYESAEEFFRVNNIGSKEEAILSHMQLFKSIEYVYGEEMFVPTMFL